MTGTYKVQAQFRPKVVAAVSVSSKPFGGTVCSMHNLRSGHASSSIPWLSWLLQYHRFSKLPENSSMLNAYLQSKLAQKNAKLYAILIVFACEQPWCLELSILYHNPNVLVLFVTQKYVIHSAVNMRKVRWNLQWGRCRLLSPEFWLHYPSVCAMAVQQKVLTCPGILISNYDNTCYFPPLQTTSGVLKHIDNLTTSWEMVLTFKLLRIFFSSCRIWRKCRVMPSRTLKLLSSRFSF